MSSSTPSLDPDAGTADAQTDAFAESDTEPDPDARHDDRRGCTRAARRHARNGLGTLTTALGALESRTAYLQDATAGIAIYLDAAAASAGTAIMVAGHRYPDMQRTIRPPRPISRSSESARRSDRHLDRDR